MALKVSGFSGTAIGVESINQVLEPVVGSVVCHGETPKSKGRSRRCSLGKIFRFKVKKDGGLRLCILSRLALGTTRPIFQHLLSHLRRAQPNPGWPRFLTILSS